MLYMCHMDLEHKSIGWTCPSCQKECVDAVDLHPRPTTLLHGRDGEVIEVHFIFKLRSKSSNSVCERDSYYIRIGIDY